MFGLRMFHLVNKRWFDSVIMAFICANAVSLALQVWKKFAMCTFTRYMCVQSFGQSGGMTKFLSVASIVFTLVFMFEAAVKLVAWRGQYFESRCAA